MSINYRQQALDGLTALLQQKPLPDAYIHYLPAAKYLLLQTCRYFYRLERIAEGFLTKAPKDKRVLAILLLGLAELHELHKPEHAVINEFVNLCKKNKFSSASGLINAVLRKSITQKPEWEKKLAHNESVKYAHPVWFIARLQADYPDDWQDILIANNQHPPMTLRINQLKMSRDDYINTYSLAGIPCRLSPSGFRLIEASDVKELPGFLEGFVSVQDEAAQLCTQFLDLKSGMHVLDACAAPGGKTAHILETMPSIKLVALELQGFRFERLKNTLQRLMLDARLIQADALELQSWWDGELFDRILIDAPCSGTGIIRRHPDIKMRRKAQSISLNLEIQQRLLQTLWQILKPGGRLVYATCSILKEENDLQIAKFLASNTQAKQVDINVDFGLKTQHGLQILPGQDQMDGFYYAVIEKIAT